MSFIINSYEVASSPSSPPVNTLRPSIDNNAPSGTGVLLTATTGTYTNSPTSYVREWRRDNIAIGGATNLTYTTVSADQGHGLSFYEKAVNSGGNSGFIRASTGVPRQFFISGDSLWSSSIIWTDLQAALGSDWLVLGIAHSGDTISVMETTAQRQLDPYVHKGWGVSFYHEYANTVVGVQGSYTGAQTFSQLEAFGQARQTAGAVVITSTCYYRSTGVKDGTQAHIASELTRTNYLTHSSGFLDIDQSEYLTSADSNDGVHWFIGTDTTMRGHLITQFTDLVTAMGLVGDCGDVFVPNAVTDTNLSSFVNPSYVYDTVNPMPYTIPFSPCYIHVTSGSGWSVGSYQVTGKIDSFLTVDGYQRMYSLNPDVGTGSLSGGHYFFSNTA